MTIAKNVLDGQIRVSITEKDSDREAARRLFLFNNSAVLQDHRSEGFRIIDAVSTHFEVPFRSVSISGSAQTGYSYFKERDFVPGQSDLDLAIVDTDLFRRYCEIVYRLTRGYSDLTQFPVKEGVSEVEKFRRYLCRGYFRPDLMPYSYEKQEWFKFFNLLGKDYSELFKNINGGVFLSQEFFEGKQIPTIRQFRKANQ